MILLGSVCTKDREFRDRILIIYGRVRSRESEKLRTDLSLGLLKQILMTDTNTIK